MNDIELGWAGGMLDGEGSILLNGKHGQKSPRLTMPSTDLPVLEEMRRIVGGYVIFRKDRRKHVHKAWMWVASASNTLDFLARAAPHLRCPLKRRRAEYLLRHWVRGRKPSSFDRESFEDGFYALPDGRELRG